MIKQYSPIKQEIENTAYKCASRHLLPILKNNSPAEFIDLVVDVYSDALLTGEVAETAKDKGLTPDEVLVSFRRGLIRALNESRVKTG